MTRSVDVMTEGMTTPNLDRFHFAQVIQMIFRRLWEIVGKKLLRVPIGLWLYLAIVLYLYRRLSREFLGIGTSNVRLRKSIFNLSREEEQLSARLVDSQRINVSFDDIGGNADAKRMLTETVVWPLRHPDLFPPGTLRSPPTGVLLHGPPGTGKTLLAKALAKELDGYFLDVSAEALFSRFVGDSEKLAAALFSLAAKLGTCVIFIDEIDSILGNRTVHDSASYGHVKSIFLSKWDGLAAQGTTCRTVVVGATNRPLILDEAALRRMPLRLEIGLPDDLARRTILELLLNKEPSFDVSRQKHRNT